MTLTNHHWQVSLGMTQPKLFDTGSGYINKKPWTQNIKHDDPALRRPNLTRESGERIKEIIEQKIKEGITETDQLYKYLTEFSLTNNAMRHHIVRVRKKLDINPINRGNEIVNMYYKQGIDPGFIASKLGITRRYALRVINENKPVKINKKDNFVKVRRLIAQKIKEGITKNKDLYPLLKEFGYKHETLERHIHFVRRNML